MNHSAELRSLIEEYVAQNKLKSNFLPIIECDSQDEASLGRMCERTRVLISAVGPFARPEGYALLVECLKKKKTHLVDISGEPLHMERARVRLHQDAVNNNVTCVTGCGFDCVPSDMTIEALLQQVPKVKSLQLIVTSETAGNVGTLMTAIESLSAQNVAELQRVRQEAKKKTNTDDNVEIPRAKRKGIHWNSQMKLWCVPFPGADPTVARNSQQERHRAVQDFLAAGGKNRQEEDEISSEISSQSYDGDNNKGRRRRRSDGVELLARNNPNPVAVDMYFGVKNIFYVLALLWVGVLIMLASKLDFLKRQLAKNPKFWTLGIFQLEPPREQLLDKWVR